MWWSENIESWSKVVKRQLMELLQLICPFISFGIWLTGFINRQHFLDMMSKLWWIWWPILFLGDITIIEMKLLCLVAKMMYTALKQSLLCILCLEFNIPPGRHIPDLLFLSFSVHQIPWSLMTLIWVFSSLNSVQCLSFNFFFHLPVLSLSRCMYHFITRFSKQDSFRLFVLCDT